MKYILGILLILPLILFAQDEKYGALAIDRSNGFYYGWAVNTKTQTEADTKALQHCKNRGGNCSVVKRWKGGYCMAYRTVEGNAGTAYGWGIAKTAFEADRTAHLECLKRSNGVDCGNFVYGCNDKSSKPKKKKAQRSKNKDDDFWSGKKDKVKKTTKSSNKKDDFWSSKSNKPKKTTSNKSDDFWSGKNDKPKKATNKSKDFWNGQGTVQEEKKFDENTKPEASDKFIGNVRSRTNRVRIFCVDTGIEDNDRVRIKNNGQTLKKDIRLTNRGKSYWFDLKFGQNKIEIIALNQGNQGSNTAAFKVYDEKGNKLAQKNWALKTGYKGTLLILKL